MRVRVPVIVASLALLFVSSAKAEPVGRYFYVAPVGGFTIFDSKNEDILGAPLTDDIYFGGRLGYQWMPWLAVEAAGGFTPTSQDVPGGLDVDYFHGSGNLLFAPWQGRYGFPFVSVGGGWSQLKPSSGGESFDQGNFEAAAGIQMWLTDLIGLRLEARDISWLPKDDVTNPESNNLVFSGGISFAIGAKARDTDADGVSDSKDKCPGTPAGATVDATGCPKDSDGDAVLDGIDKCPNTPKGATVDATGCPKDGDGDGVFDGIDQCADTPKGATVDAKGCPTDSDGDGVFDGVDQCQGTPKGAVVDEKGCPKDSDGDGVPDGLDKCPDTAAGLKVDKDGCPIEVMERETEMLDTGMIRLQNINFETGKAALLPESFPTLDVVGQMLTKWPDLKIEIGGHTDSRGSVASNQKLSDARAKAVEGYLLQKYPTLKDEQFSTKGYGEAKPLVPNSSDLNMAKNRRVEFTVLNKDVLKKEIERRKLLKEGEQK